MDTFSVEKLQKELKEKEKELHKQTQFSQDRLLILVKMQRIVESKKLEGEAVLMRVESIEKEILKREERAEIEIARVAPIYCEGREGVQGLKSYDFGDIRILVNPPKIIKRVFESVLKLVDRDFASRTAATWVSIKRRIVNPRFLPDIVNFRVHDLTNVESRRIRQLVRGLQIDACGRASPVCGILSKWLMCNVAYSSILERVKPLRMEISKIKNVKEKYQQKGEGIMNKITQLESQSEEMEEIYYSSYKKMQNIKSKIEEIRKQIEQVKIAEKNEKLKSNFVEHCCIKSPESDEQSMENILAQFSKMDEYIKSVKQEILKEREKVARLQETVSKQEQTIEHLETENRILKSTKNHQKEEEKKKHEIMQHSQNIS